MRPPSSSTDIAERPPSLAHMLLVWVFVGFSLAGFSARLLDALRVLPLSTLDGGLLLGTLVFAVLWVGGFRPPIRAAFVYFLVESVASLVLVVGLVSLFGPDTGPAPWSTVAGRGLAIVLSGGLVFGGVGGRLFDWVRERGRSLLGLPPRDDPTDSR